VICTSMNFIVLNSDRSWKFPKSKIVRIRFPVYYNVMAEHGTPLRLSTLLLFLTFMVITANQTCEQKSSEMHYALAGHAHNSIELNEYPSCLNACLGDGKCVSFNYNFVTLLCELSNKTKGMEPASFIEKKYSTYTEVLR